MRISREICYSLLTVPKKMNCPECRSAHIIPTRSGEYACSECGIVLEDARVFDQSPAFSLTHTPLKSFVLPGTTIGFSPVARSELERRLRRTQKFSLNPYTNRQIAWYQCKFLKTQLEIPISDADLLGRYRQIRQGYPATCHLSAKNLASVIFYMIAKEFRHNFNFSDYLTAAELTHSQFWGIKKRLCRYSGPGDEIYSHDAVRHNTAAELSKVQDGLGLPSSVVRLSSQLVLRCSLSSIGRINTAAIIVAAQRFLKARGLLRGKKIPARRIFAFLKVAPATAYAKIGAWQLEVKCASILRPKATVEESAHKCCEPIISSTNSPPISFCTHKFKVHSQITWHLWKPMMGGQHLRPHREFSVYNDSHPNFRVHPGPLLFLPLHPRPSTRIERSGAITYFLSSSRGKSPAVCSIY